MAKKPNFDFERRERQKAKDAKRAEKTKGKAERKTTEITEPDSIAATSDGS